MHAYFYCEKWIPFTSNTSPHPTTLYVTAHYLKSHMEASGKPPQAKSFKDFNRVPLYTNRHTDFDQPIGPQRCVESKSGLKQKVDTI